MPPTTHNTCEALLADMVSFDTDGPFVSLGPEGAFDDTHLFASDKAKLAESEG